MRYKTGMNYRTNLALIIMGSLFGGIYFCVVLPLGGLLMAERGVPLWQIGLLGGIPWGATLAATLCMLCCYSATSRGGFMCFRAGLRL